VSAPLPRLERSSIPLFNALAPDYDAHFEIPHRRAYDELAWERVADLLPDRGGYVIDVGCGSGRWAPRLISRGHRVLGIERAPIMAAYARHRGFGDAFTIVENSMEAAEVAEGEADLVLAMGSVQYTEDPILMIRRFAGWARPGAWVCVLVDSLFALVIELLRSGREDEALLRLQTRKGIFTQLDLEADHHLFDRAGLEASFADAGLIDVNVAGLIVSATILGVDVFNEQLRRAPEAQMARERRLMGEPLLADLGKQLLATGRRPG
jgi:SAM-dependent methyltransferase